MSKKIFIVTAIVLAIFTMYCMYSEETATAAGTSVETKKENTPLTEFSQKITTASKIKEMKAKEIIKIKVKVENISKQTWPGTKADKSVRLTYNWIDNAGKKIVSGGIRTLLPNDLAPRKSVMLKASVKAPDAPGSYTLQFTMVQENVAWFDKKGAKTLDIPIIVK